MMNHTTSEFFVLTAAPALNAQPQISDPSLETNEIAPTRMKELFPDFDLDAFTAKFESLRLSKQK